MFQIRHGNDGGRGANLREKLENNRKRNFSRFLQNYKCKKGFSRPKICKWEDSIMLGLI